MRRARSSRVALELAGFLGTDLGPFFTLWALAWRFFAGRFLKARLGVRLRGAGAARFRFGAFRLAIALVLSNLDSFAISVVLSVAYRNLESADMGPGVEPEPTIAGCRLVLRDRQWPNR